MSRSGLWPPLRALRLTGARHRRGSAPLLAEVIAALFSAPRLSSTRVIHLPPIEVRHHGAAGRTVVVLHGGPGAPGSALGLARCLAASFRVLEPLQRRSGAVPLTVERHVADLAAVMPERAAIVGWSWGAMLGLSFAARHPERVSGLVVVGCGTYDESSRADVHLRLAERLGETGRVGVEALKKELAGEPDARRRDALFAKLGAEIGRAEAYDRFPDDAAEEPGLLADAAGYQETWDDALRLQREGVEPAIFANIRAGVLMLHGAANPHPGPETRDVLRRFLPQLEYVELLRSGHEPWHERQARASFFEIVRDWLHGTGGCADTAAV